MKTMRLCTKKTIVQAFLALLCMISTTLLSAQNPVNADIIVALDGSGNYTKIQDAINAVPNNSERRTVIYLKAGTYDTEKLIIPATKKNISFIGESRDRTIISYHMYDCTSPESANKCPADAYELWKNNSDLVRTSATLTISADGFRAENLTIENTAGPVGQALAITVTGDKSIFRNCNIKSYQDTIYLWTAGKRSYFENCLVVGRTDYIYGAGIAFFQACEIRSWGGGWITAPSTPQYQPYGYVFNECKVTYATSSPRSGDDGTPFSLGRPWHEYPKVSWLYCEMSEMLNPLGWPTKWNMDYADTSVHLKLYEYKNTGAGADTTGRADWAGIRSMTDEEALEYTVQKVMAGNDDWDPTQETSPIVTYTWNGNASGDSWLEAANWEPAGVPATGQSATIEGEFTAEANGNRFEADLTVGSGATLSVAANSEVNYLAMAGGSISSDKTCALSGTIQIKSETGFHITGKLELKASLQGVNSITKTGNGKLILNADNTNFHGDILIEEGSVSANASNSIGSGDLRVGSGALAIMNADNCFNPKSVLHIENGGKVELNRPVVLSELFINGTLSEPGQYNASTHPAIFSGSESITVGRPTSFTWTAAESKTWENPNNYKPALLPMAGDTAIVEVEMETSGVPFEAVILLQKTNIRLRNAAVSNADILMNDGTKITYATSGVGFSLEARIKVLGSIVLQMSGNPEGCSMTFPGSFTSDPGSKITAYNYTNYPDMTASAILAGNNEEFTGIWDLTMASRGSGSSATFEGTAEKAFGKGVIEVDNGNKVVISHAKATGMDNTLNLASGTKVVMNTDGLVGKLTLGNEVFSSGEFNSVSHPAFFEGNGTLTVSDSQLSGINNLTENKTEVRFDGKTFYAVPEILSIEIFNLAGICVEKKNVSAKEVITNLPGGIYIAKVKFSEGTTYKKIIINN